MCLRLRFLTPVPPDGADVDHRRDLRAHQLRLLLPLVVHRHGDPGTDHPSTSLPRPPATFPGQCVKLHRLLCPLRRLLLHLPFLTTQKKVPLAVVGTFTAVCFFIVGLSLYSDPWNTGISCALTLTGIPVYYVTVYRYCLPRWLRRIFGKSHLPPFHPKGREDMKISVMFPDYFSKQLQILLEVSQQEVKTF